jgi:hypothetical protein
MGKTIQHRLLWLSSILYLNACASSSLFNPYPNQAQEYKQAIINDDYSGVTEKLDKKKQSADTLLYLQESARLNQLAGNTEQSQVEFAGIEKIYQHFDEQARISASDIGAKAASLVSNENAIPYQGAAYERILALQFQAFNYLDKNDAEGAAVEIRRAGFEQRQQALKYDEALSKTQQEAKKQNVDNKSWADDPAFAGMDEYSSALRNSFLNAYTFYTSAAFWEAAKDYNAALIDYKKALEIQPNNKQLIEDVKRASAKQNGQYKANNNSGSLVILFEEGFVPAKRSISLTLPSFYYDTIFSVAVPYYERADFPLTETLKITKDKQLMASTELLTDVSALAVKHLKEQMPALVMRQILRARSKYEVQRQAANQSELGGFIATVYNIVSEQGDLRSWLTLPNSLQATRVELSSGTHSLMLNNNKAIEIDIHPEKTTLLRVIKASNRYIVNQYML